MPLFLPSVPLSGGTMTGPLVIGGGTVTASTPVLDLAQTWNLAGTTFTGLKFNVTDSASVGGSLLMDLQVGGSYRFQVTKSGTFTALGSAFVAGGNISLSGSGDVTILREAAGILSLRNAANAQTWNVYGTYTDNSNYRRLRSTMTTGGAVTIAAEGLGTGVSGNTITFSASNGLIIANSVLLNAGVNLGFETGTGTKLGTATTQKLGFWNATPIVQPSGTGETVGFTAGGGTTVTDASTFTGNVGSTAYRLSDIVKHLKNEGLLAQ